MMVDSLFTEDTIAKQRITPEGVYYGPDSITSICCILCTTCFTTFNLLWISCTTTNRSNGVWACVVVVCGVQL